MRRKTEGLEALAEATGCGYDTVQSFFDETKAPIHLPRGLSHGLARPLKELHSLPEHYQDYLYALVRLTRPDLVIETGVATGRSTWRILSALNKNGYHNALISIDPTVSFDLVWNLMPHLGSELLNRDERRWIRIDKPSGTALPYLASLHIQPDLFLHDSDHSYEVQTFEYEWAWENLKSGGWLCSDDLYWDGRSAWEDFCTRIGKDYWAMGNMGAIRK